MKSKELSTREAILTAGKEEFLRKGFSAASLRQIVKEAGVTTGAFYGYYRSKEELFRALVEEPARVLMDTYKDAHDCFAVLPKMEQPGEMARISGECMEWMVDYVYENFDAFKLIICKAEGTEYENFIDTMVRIESESTDSFVSVLREIGHEIVEIDSQLQHILISGFFSAFFEIVIHNMPKQQAMGYVQELRAFYSAGWTKIMGL